MTEVMSFLLRHWELTAVFLVLLVGFLINEWWHQRLQVFGLSPQAVVQQLNHQHALVYDLRPVADFNEAHILGSNHFTIETLANIQGKNKQKPIILVASPKLIQVARERLKANGYTTVYHLEGGIEAWRTAGLPLNKVSS